MNFWPLIVTQIKKFGNSSVTWYAFDPTAGQAENWF